MKGASVISLAVGCPCRLATALYSSRDGTGEIRDILVSATFNPRLPGALRVLKKWQ